MRSILGQAPRRAPGLVLGLGLLILLLGAVIAFRIMALRDGRTGAPEAGELIGVGDSVDFTVRAGNGGIIATGSR